MYDYDNEELIKLYSILQCNNIVIFITRYMYSTNQYLVII